MANNFDNSQSEHDQQRDNADVDDQNLNGGVSVSSGVSSNPSSATRRLTQILMEEGEGDLLLQRSDVEDGVLQWIGALDMQLMGACRADERLKPLLKLNVSSGVTEDPLLSHLSQHFEPSEVGMLARCLCMPLVSIRVGKIIKQGTLLSPTSKRGHLCLTLLPTSDLRISFNGDDGSIERLATLCTKVSCSSVKIEDIPSDKSGRSFFISISDDFVSYYWCSEKSKLLGDELLIKMKDLLIRKPSLAELTGISESRLDFFARQLRAHLSGSILTSSQDTETTFSSDDSFGLSEHHFSQTSLNFQKGSKSNLTYQGSLSPRSSSFKEGLPKCLSSIKSAAKGKMRRRGENYVAALNTLNIVSLNGFKSSKSDFTEKHKLSESNESLTFTSLNFIDICPKSLEIQLSAPDKQVPSHFSPHYCWCPPAASVLQYTLSNSQLPIPSTELPILPPLSSLLSAAQTSTLLTSKSSLNLSDLPPLNFPSLLPNPLASFPTLPTSQQIPTFNPLICDPIVHIPVIDVCSSGQGYLVSAGPTMSNVISPLLPNAESIAEKSARETLRMLISGSSLNPQLFEVMPSFLNSNDGKQNVFVAGSRSLYSGTKDVDAISNIGSILLSENSMGSGIGKGFSSRDDTSDANEKPSSSDSWFD